MLTFAWYLLKVMLCSGILYGYYLIALRNKKFHQYNRFYLLAVVSMSFLIPLIKLELWKEAPQSTAMKVITLVTEGDAYVARNTSFWNFDNIAFAAFSIISFIFLLSVIYSVLKIFVLVKRHPKQTLQRVCFVFSNTPGTPFSFFKYIFWNEEIDIESESGKHILKHELAHIDEKHSYDKLFLNLALIIGWYNPLLWLIRRELNIIHEFIADRKTVDDGDVQSFAVMLLKTAFPSHPGMLTNSFFHSPIKRRLIMLTTNHHWRYPYFPKLMALPLLTAVILLFSCRKEEKIPTVQSKNNVALSKEIATSAEELPAQFPRGSEGWRKYLEKNLNANITADNHAPAGLYTVMLQFTVHQDGTISNIEAKTKPGYGTEEEAIKVIAKGPKWIPAKKDGAAIETQVRQAITFMVSEE